VRGQYAHGAVQGRRRIVFGQGHNRGFKPGAVVLSRYKV
jgi:hypothetical protein